MVRYQVTDPTLVDFDMMQTGHSSHLSFPNTIKCLQTSRGYEPTMPTLVGEVCYEGIVEVNREENSTPGILVLHVSRSSRTYLWCQWYLAGQHT